MRAFQRCARISFFSFFLIFIIFLNCAGWRFPWQPQDLHPKENELWSKFIMNGKPSGLYPLPQISPIQRCYCYCTTTENKGQKSAPEKNGVAILKMCGKMSAEPADVSAHAARTRQDGNMTSRYCAVTHSSSLRSFHMLSFFCIS